MKGSELFHDEVGIDGGPDEIIHVVTVRNWYGHIGCMLCVVVRRYGSDEKSGANGALSSPFRSLMKLSVSVSIDEEGEVGDD